ncbi:unnamed protein product, partial [Rotaria sp. Silwood1]
SMGGSGAVYSGDCGAGFGLYGGPGGGYSGDCGAGLGLSGGGYSGDCGAGLGLSGGSGGGYDSGWHIPIPFSFLPVNRIATQLQIHDIEDREPCSSSCENHGRCMRCTNNKSLFFCQCEHGYSGPRCNIQHRCSCTNDSYCLTSSICVCSLHKFGPRCHLKNSIYQSNNTSCQHNGLCTTHDDRISFRKFTYFCKEDYSGERCESRNNEITIPLHETITTIASSLFIHFITAFSNVKHEQITLFSN